MAEQKAESTTRTFDSVTFPQFKEGYKVKIEFDAEAETITLLFINTTDTKTYCTILSKSCVDKITARCQLSVGNLCRVIMDQLSSSEFVNKFCRLFVFTNAKQGTLMFSFCASPNYQIANSIYSEPIILSIFSLYEI